MSHDVAAERFVSRLLLESDTGARLSDTRIRLLEAIDRLGSISQAARAVPLSYKAAWDALDLLNNTSPEPLVVRTTGGRQGGGTQLTPYGRRMVVMYRALEMEYQAMLDQVMARMNEAQHTDIREFQRLMQRMSMKTSARNQFVGRVIGLRDGGMNYQVHLQLSDSQEMVAMITKTSAEYLGIRMGGELFALLKATSVHLHLLPEEVARYGNQLWGEVQSMKLNRNQMEVQVKLPGERSLFGLLSSDAVADMGLQTGSAICACFDPEQVLLATYE